MPRVNPENLRWARQTAGFDEATAARKIGLNEARGVSSPDRVRELEEGKVEPSRALLSRMADAYRRPLLAFYMAEPPRAAARVEDFRSLPDQHPEAEPLVQTLVRDVRARQALVRELLEDDESPEVALVASLRTADGAPLAAQQMGTSLGFSLVRFRECATPDAAFAYLRGLVERQGIFVLLIGDLGTHHTAIDTEAFRGFALADKLAPFIVINDRDAHTAWAFTLLHELAHIFLGVTGVSGARSVSAVERFCNDVASRILLPDAEVAALAVAGDLDLTALAVEITRAANPRRVSRTLIAFRLFQAAVLREDQWEDLRTQFAREWREGRADQKEKRRASGQKGGPDYYVVRRQRLGALVAVVGRAVQEGTLTASKAGKVLGVGARSVEPLIRAAA